MRFRCYIFHMKYGEKAVVKAVLEVWENPNTERDYEICISFPEFTMDMPAAIRAVTERRDLKADDMRTVMQTIMTGQATPAQIGALAVALAAWLPFSASAQQAAPAQQPAPAAQQAAPAPTPPAA